MFRKISLLAALCCAASGAHAATVTSYEGNRAGFLSALGGAATTLQDFSSFENGDSLDNVEFIPGVVSTSSAGALQVFGSNQSMFVVGGRDGEELSYIMKFGDQNWTAFGFDIRAFNPATRGPVRVVAGFADASISAFDLFPTNPTESDPFFFGLISSSPLVRLVVFEGPELDGTCCEEISLDDFIAADVAVPIPAGFFLFAPMAAAFGWLGRRR